MKQQTAVEWLVEQYIEGNYGWEIYEQAKAMEKKQIINAIDYGCSDWGSSKDSEEYYDITYEGKLTFKEKQQWLRENGWRTSWSDDNWLQRDKEYSNPDWAGMSTEQAYEYATTHPKPSTIEEIEEWERKNGKL